MRSVMAACAVGLLAACGGGAPQGAAGDTMPAQLPAAAPADTLAGRIESFGADPMTYPVLRSGAAVVRLAGPMQAELGRLTGAEVRVWGTRSADVPQDRLQVSGYDRVVINGRPARVGTVGRQDGELVLRAGVTTWRLTGAPDALVAAEGARVYVVGSETDGRIAVESWGVIRRP